jgi:hypothetical protein
MHNLNKAKLQTIDETIAILQGYYIIEETEDHITACGLQGLVPVKIDYTNEELSWNIISDEEYLKKTGNKSPSNAQQQWAEKLETIVKLNELIEGGECDE